MLNNPEKVKKQIIEWIREYFEENGPGCSAVVGISGGKDSSVTAALLAEALGRERVVGVLMPDGVQADIEDSREVVKAIGIPNITVNIHDGVSGLKKAIADAEGFETVCGRKEFSKDAGINLPPRMRMAVLYAIAQNLPNGGRVANTCNASEDYVGYSTKYGDAAGDFSLLSHLLVEEVRQIGALLPIPDHLVQKTPSDGLSGLSDEDKLGFTYEMLDHYILTGECPDLEKKERIDRLHKINLHKLRPMPFYEPDPSER
ncbi:MAG: NAD(+) synthase [Eubacterium sp.]|nr:NAD(+) synthase [Eubacterium sp.]